MSFDTPEIYQDAKVYRVGVTNAADRGLDMWGNFGAAIQIKHISITPKTIEDISNTLYSAVMDADLRDLWYACSKHIPCEVII